MPLYEFMCDKCGKFEIYHWSQSGPELFLCNCGDMAVRVPSLTGFRRDHTVNGSEEGDSNVG